MARLLLVVPLVLVALAALIWSQFQAPAFFVSGYLDAPQIRLGSRVGGRVAEVLVEEGTAVPAGAPLVKLEPYDWQEQLAQARASLAAREADLARLRAGARKEEIASARARRDQAKAALDEAVAGPRPDEIAAQEARVAAAEAELIKAQRDQTRIQRLFDEQRAADEELDAANRGAAVASARLSEARAQLALLREGTRAEQIAQARARLAEAEEALALLEAGSRAEDIVQAEALVAAARAASAILERQLTELQIVAPRACIVEAIDLEPGDLVGPNAPVVSVLAPDELWVRAFVPENHLNIEVGQKVAVRVDAFPQRRFAGHIAFVSRTAEFTPSNIQTPEDRSKQVYRIKVILDEGFDVLRIGMGADVYFDAGNDRAGQ